MTLRPALNAPRPPVPPAAPPRASFPLIGALAPILSAAVLFALTSSPYTLALAALGPVVAAASYLDGRRVRRRTMRSDAERYAREQAAFEAASVEESARELAALRRATPSPLDILEGSVSPDTRWRRDPAALVLVLGRGVVDRRGSSGVLQEAPLLVELREGIGIVGPPVLARAAARGLLLQCAELVAPEGLALELPDGEEWDALRSLPHARQGSGGVHVAVIDSAPGTAHRTAPADVVIALAGRASDLPPACHCVVELGAPRGPRVIGRTSPGSTEEVLVDYVSAEQAREYAVALARSTGGGGEHTLPSTVRLSELGALRRTAGEPGLPAVLGVTASGVLELDLVRDGPHAIVGGTTGSGKSELLIAWIIALAARHSPSAVTFLLADFKGGAGFGALGKLPHVTGVITDLDPVSAGRAFASIGAELKRREVVLAEHGVSDVARLAPGVLARLVIVVDECAVVLERAPELHRTFADIAARGRSLGVHLVLCTQRPAGVVRDAVAANCGLRIALRVHDAVDSRTLIGSDAAARIPHGSAGRCVVTIGGRGSLAQAALAHTEDVEHATSLADRAVAVHRPWLDPLPDRIPLPPLRAGRILLGVVDRPAEQRQDVVDWRRRSLLVLGAAQTGRSGVLGTVRAQLGGARIVSAADAEEAWDAITAEKTSGGPLLVDDLDLLLRRCTEDERRRLLDALQTALRTGSDLIVATARRTTDGLAALRDAFDDVLLLRAANRQEHQLLAVDGEPYRGDLPPGGGWWRGERLQVFAHPPARSRAARSRVSLVPVGERPVAVLTNRAGRLRPGLTALTPAVLSVGDASATEQNGIPVVIGSVAEWSQARGLLEGLRRRGAVVVDVPPGEARILLGPLSPAPLCVGDRVLLERDGALERARWPLREETGQEESAV